MKVSSSIQLLILFLLSAFTPLASLAQDNSTIADQITAQSYTFKAQLAIPATGTTRQLTSEYDVKVSPSAIDVYLPYFGRAYTAPVNPADGGLHFTSTNFDYVSAPAKKGGWNIRIRPKDTKEVRELNLSVSEKGFATLNVISNNKQVISFNGYIAEQDSK